MRKISSLLAIWAVMIMAMPTFANTRLQDDLITIGKPGSTANKRIKLGSQEIRSNTATSKLEYTHDGVTYKPIGSGSGSGGSSGGINLVANDSFEDPITTGWSNTGGTLTQESYSIGTETDAKFARFVATAAGQYFETPLITVPTNFSGGCQADFKKISVSADDLFKVEILDSSSNVLAASNVKQSSWVKFPTIGTTCPTPGSQFRLRVTSLAAGTIDSDYGYLGSNQNLVNISQSKPIGTITWPATANCFWTLVNTTAWSTFPVDADCGTPTVTGDITAPSTKVPGFGLKVKGAGTYLIVTNAMAYITPGNTKAIRWIDIDNGNYTNHVSGLASTANASFGSFSSKLEYSTSGVKNIVLQGIHETSGTIELYSDKTTRQLSVEIYYFPSSTETAVNTDQASWLIDANIGGGNVPMGTGAISTYTETSFATADLVINTNKGSASAEIPCAGTNPSTGLTCSSSNESIGIAFTPPQAGSYEACFDFTTEFGSNGAQNIVWQLVETPNNSQTILQEGGRRANIGSASASSTPNAQSINLCGSFNFADTSKKTIRLMYEKVATAGSPNLIMDRDSTAGQRDIKVTVRPILSAYNRPILTSDQVKTRGAINPEIFSAAYGGASLNSVCPTSSSCTLYNKIGTGISSVNQATAGAFTLGFDKTFSVVNCTATTIGASTVAPPVNSGTTPPMSCSNCNSMIFVTGNPASTYVSTYGTINCIAIP